MITFLEYKKTVEEIKECLLNGDFITALEKLKEIQMENNQKEEEINQKRILVSYGDFLIPKHEQ